MKHRLEYLMVRALIAVVRVTPAVVVRGAGTLLGLAFYTIDGAHRRIAQRNLQWHKNTNAGRDVVKGDADAGSIVSQAHHRSRREQCRVVELALSV